jgi:hypothetical protein
MGCTITDRLTMQWNGIINMNVIFPRAAGGGRSSCRLMMMPKMTLRKANVKGLFCRSLDGIDGGRGMKKHFMN